MLDTILAYGKCILDFALLFWFTMQFFTLRWEKRRPVYSSVSHKFTVHTGAEYNDCSSLQSDLKPDALQGQYRREASLFLL